MAECAGLENRWARKGPVSSNLTSSVVPLSIRSHFTYAAVHAACPGNSKPHLGGRTEETASPGFATAER